MKLFIFEDLQKMSFNYHSQGAVVVVAKDIEEARKLAEERINNTKGYLSESDKDIKIPVTAEYREYSLLDDYSFSPSGEYLPEVYLFPDAGCC